MKKSSFIQNLIFLILTGGILISTGIFVLAVPGKEYSDSERRYLAQKPEISLTAFQDGDFKSQFERYGMDQFPFRDQFRSYKSFWVRHVMLQKDYQGLYEVKGSIAKMDYPLSYDMLDYAADKFTSVYHTYLEPVGTKPYMVIVPDKNYYLAGERGNLSLDYAELLEAMEERLPDFQMISIEDLLCAEDYYRTDSHWKQERLNEVAQKIRTHMGLEPLPEYEIVPASDAFYGVYTGQFMGHVSPDEMYYITNDILKNCEVVNYDTGKGKPAELYNFEKLTAKDPYEMYLEGAVSLITIENKKQTNGKELVLFRDSFGSSLAPYFVDAYEKITVVDLRYIRWDYLGAFVDFENADVLMEYSTLLLNNSLSLR